MKNDIKYTKEEIEEIYREKKLYLDKQCEKMTEENILSVLIKTIKGIEEGERFSDYSDFKESDLLYTINAYNFMYHDDIEIESAEDMTQKLKETLYEWILKSKEMNLSNLEEA